MLADVNAKTAAARPIKNAHSIWELLLHIAAWDDAVTRRVGGAASLSDEPELPAGHRYQRSRLEPGRGIRQDAFTTN